MSSKSSPSTRKRKHSSSSSKEAAETQTVTAAPKEKRAARYRSAPTEDIQTRIVRALNQRLYLISQEDKSSSESGLLSKHFTILGSTGNVYDVIVDKKPCCTCPGTECAANITWWT